MYLSPVYTYLYYYLLVITSLLLLVFPFSTSIAQVPVVRPNGKIMPDSLNPGNLIGPVDSLDPGKILKGANLLKGANPLKGADSLKSGNWLKPSYPSKSLLELPRFQAPLSKPFLRIEGGYVAYNADYRSFIDTPFAEKNIIQHSVNASVNIRAASLPLIANAWIRRSNSSYFRDINDLQLIFNAAQFRNDMVNALKAKWLALSRDPGDSLLKSTYQRSQQELNGLRHRLDDPMQIQKLIEANETLRVPAKSSDPSLPDSVNRKRIDSMQGLARIYIETYNKTKGAYDSVGRRLDSLGTAYKALVRREQQYRDMLNGKALDTYSRAQLEEAMQKGDSSASVPDRYKWILGVRNFALGKSAANYSELTAKNISTTGINFTYNSWYYFAVSAGLIDNSFNNIGIKGVSAPRQYMYLLRAGIGRLEKNYLIFSYYQGKKQIYNTGDSAGHGIAVPVSGVSAELRWRLNKYAWVVTEAAQSLSPDYRYNPPISKPGFNLSDKTTKALSSTLQVYVPVTSTRVEAMYKYTGADFQSFSSYQPSSEWKTWYVKAEQPFLHRTLKVTASLRSNDFSNPYLAEDYKGSTVFKTLQVSYHARNWPSLTVGYVPISQLSVVDSQVVEHRFQSLTANINHYYKLGMIRMSSVAVLSKFYNNSSDTGFVYYNATNLLVDQRVFFRDFTIGLSLSESLSDRYSLNVAGEELSFNLGKWGTLAMGARINNLNKQQTKIGEYFNVNIRISPTDYLTVNTEHSYLPSSTGNLVPNDFGNIQFIKRFK